MTKESPSPQPHFTSIVPIVFEASPTPPISSLVTTIILFSPSSSHGMQAKIKMKMGMVQAAF
jgi:hypothetical protein